MKDKEAATAKEAAIENVRFRTGEIPTTPDPTELGNMGAMNSPLTPTPEMAGLADSDVNLNQSMPNPYVYQPQGTNTYTPKMYADYYARKRKYQGDTFNQ
jgi:hypothetical protein